MVLLQYLQEYCSGESEQNNMERANTSLKHIVGLILTSTYETIFELPDIKNLDSISKDDAAEKSASLLSFINGKQNIGTVIDAGDEIK
ncbi:MAG: hypothetical protein WA461_13800 [Nitrososphaeraceae archaeon]